ncbi:hypothetical protein VKT23_004027 [Stygiomarasmius scandens]|uniref:AN1-type domain-containing protein n=1 Tax=Marasmiellus scandens TaxID=2682957 RepID=A0ABR1JUG2_9AGAR
MDVNISLDKCCICQQPDFLPISCNLCSRLFCNQHIHAHDCPDAVSSSLSTASVPLSRCAFDACNDPSVIACPDCQHPFCPRHRHSNDHTCSEKPQPPPVKNQAARALLAAHFPASSRTTKSTKPTTKNLKLELMKMRQRAVSADPKLQSSTMSPQNRCYVKVQVNDGPEKVFWLERTVIAGRAFDLLATQMGIPSSSFDHYHLCKKSDDQFVALQNDLLFSEQVVDGDSIVLSNTTS